MISSEDIYKGKKIVVTGASRGIGLALVEYFLENGASVIGISRSKSDVTLKNYFHVTTDIKDAVAVAKAFIEIAAKFETVDILINNAAVLTSQYSLVMTAKQAEDMLSTNVLGTFYVTKEAVKLMRRGKWGRIVNIGSMAQKLEPIGDSLYAGSKSAIQTMINTMAKEFSSYGITCNTLGVTAIQTDMLKQLPVDKIDKVVSSLPLGRYAEMSDIINVINFFASPHSSYVTAQEIFLGGIH